MITGKYLSTIGRAQGLKFGLLFVVAQLVLLGSLKFVENTRVFISLSFFAQFLGGIGAGLNSTCAVAIISTFFKDDREYYIGILEGGVGVGMLVGPLLGALLYSLGGYLMPFWTVAGIVLALYPMLIHTVNYIQVRERAHDL